MISYYSQLSKVDTLGTKATVRFNPFIPKSDQFQISPAASPEILHHTVWRICLFIAYSDERWSYYQFSLTRSYISLKNVGRMYFLNLGMKGLKRCPPWASFTLEQIIPDSKTSRIHRKIIPDSGPIYTRAICPGFVTFVSGCMKAFTLVLMNLK